MTDDLGLGENISFLYSDDIDDIIRRSIIKKF